MILLNLSGVGRNKSTLITFESDLMGGGAGGDYHTTYYGEPTFISDRGYLVHSEATDYTVLDFRQTEFHEIGVHGDIGYVGNFIRNDDEYAVFLEKACTSVEE